MVLCQFILCFQEDSLNSSKINLRPLSVLKNFNSFSYLVSYKSKTLLKFFQCVNFIFQNINSHSYREIINHSDKIEITHVNFSHFHSLKSGSSDCTNKNHNVISKIIISTNIVLNSNKNMVI